jgi:PEGA domain
VPAPQEPPPFLTSLDTGPSFAARSLTKIRALGEPLGALGERLRRWLPLLVAATALAAGVAGGLYWWSLPSKTRVATLKPVAVRPPITARKASGALHVTSTPSGAQVLVDGKARGATPLMLTDLIAGRHTVELKSDAGTVERTVSVDADKTAEVTESIFSGWLAVYSPFDLVITEGGRPLRLDDRHQVLLAPGQHELRLVNQVLGYDAVRQVSLKPGEMTSLSVTPPPSTLTVTATEAAEVWLDGARVGDAPVYRWPVELGSHEIVIKRAAGGDRRYTVTMTVKPFTLNVDFTKPGT